MVSCLSPSQMGLVNNVGSYFYFYFEHFFLLKKQDSKFFFGYGATKPQQTKQTLIKTKT